MRQVLMATLAALLMLGVVGCSGSATGPAVFNESLTPGFESRNDTGSEPEYPGDEVAVDQRDPGEQDDELALSSGSSNSQRVPADEQLPGVTPTLDGRELDAQTDTQR